MGGLFTRFGAASMVAGATVFLTAGWSAPVQASAVTPAVTCTNHYSGDPNDGVLTAYHFFVNGTKQCDLQAITVGSTITADFTTANGNNTAATVTLVAYTAPTNYFNRSLAGQQVIFSTQTGVFSPGQHSLTVTVPPCDFQVDFVMGNAIAHFGNPNNWYYIHHQLADAATGPAHDVQCATTTPTPTPTPTPTAIPTPTGGVQGTTATPVPTTSPTGGVQGISTPATGASAGGNSTGQALFGIVLMVLGLIAFATAKRRAESSS